MLLKDWFFSKGTLWNAEAVENFEIGEGRFKKWEIPRDSIVSI